MVEKAQGARRPFAVLIAGPTASGKTALAINLAQKLGAVILNGDSMQIYRELNVLTARPSPAELAQADHRLFGHISGNEPYNVMRWLEEISGELREAVAAQRPVVIVGGTGLYFKAALEGISLMPDIDAEVRAYWRRFAQQAEEGALHAALASRDAQMATRLHAEDTQRLVRALEVYDSTGKSLSYWQQERSTPILRPGDVCKLVLMPERRILHDRIHQRFDMMMQNGALEEAVALAGRDYGADMPVMKAIGVPQLVAASNGEISLEAAIEKCKTETRRYAKRQSTFFRGQLSDWPLVDPLQADALRETSERICQGFMQ